MQGIWKKWRQRVVAWACAISGGAFMIILGAGGILGAERVCRGGLSDTEPACSEASKNQLGASQGIAAQPKGPTVAPADQLPAKSQSENESGESLRLDRLDSIAPVSSLVFSPDGQNVLIGSEDGIARLWDVQTGRQIRRFDGHTWPVLSVAFSPDGRQALTGSGDWIARLWDVQTGKELRRFEGHTGSVYAVAFSPDGRQVQTGSKDHTARLWDVQTGRQVHRFEGHTHWAWSVAFSPDGRQVLTGSRDKTARLWDAQTGRELRRFEGHTWEISAVAFSPNGRQVWTCSFDATVRLWDVETGKEIRRLKEHPELICSLALSRNGRWVLTGGEKTAWLLDRQTGQELRRFEAHSLPVTCVAFSPDDRLLLTGSWDGMARLWHTETGQLIGTFCLLQQGRWITIAPRTFIYDGKETTRNLLRQGLLIVDAQGNERPLSDADFDRFHRPDLVEKALRR